MYVLGRAVRDKPEAIARERCCVVREDSFPPFRIAALPVRLCRSAEHNRGRGRSAKT